MGDRVVFVCRDSSGVLSPGVYLHVGGEGALDLLREAAPCMRASNGSDAAAGLCGYIFECIGAADASDGMLSLFDSPKLDADGNVNWADYSHGDAGVVVVDLQKGSAECFCGYLEGETVEGLQFADT